MTDNLVNGWSFCIVSAEGVNENLNNVVKSIYKEFKDSENYEIIIIGNSTVFDPNIKVKNIFLKDEFIFNFGLGRNRFKKAFRSRSFKPFFYKTGAICHKKNLGVKNAVFNKYAYYMIILNCKKVGERGSKTMEISGVFV